MTIHETSDEQFLRDVVSKPFDAVSSLEFMRLWRLANSAHDCRKLAEQAKAANERLQERLDRVEESLHEFQREAQSVAQRDAAEP